MKARTKKRNEEIAALIRLKDTSIDLSDIPEVKDWSRAEIGKFYRRVKASVTIRLDADILAWLKMQGKGYQTGIKELLRAAMMQKYLGRANAPEARLICVLSDTFNWSLAFF